MSNFIKITKEQTTGEIGGLSRSIVLATREAVTGYDADVDSGLIKIKASDAEDFKTSNAASEGLVSAINILFAQTFKPPHVYILSQSTGITAAALAKANRDVRAWSFITLVSQSQGISDATNYYSDLGKIGTFCTSNDKICVHTASIEESSTGALTIPTQLAKTGAIFQNKRIKTIISNSHKERTSKSNASQKIKTYDNVGLAWMGFNLYGSAVSRSWGALSSSHDFKEIKSDTYSTANRSVIADAGFAQYNGAKDRAGAAFVYDTYMNNSKTQIETQAAIDYIEDYVYVYVRNSLQKAGQEGVPSDNVGVNRIKALTDIALQNCYSLNLILSTEQGQADYVLTAMSPAQITKKSPDWQSTGVWPQGVISANIKAFGATHYITLSFVF